MVIVKKKKEEKVYSKNEFIVVENLQLKNIKETKNMPRHQALKIALQNVKAGNMKGALVSYLLNGSTQTFRIVSCKKCNIPKDHFQCRKINNEDEYYIFIANAA